MPTNYQTETLSFPIEYSVGRINVYRADEQSSSEALEARGDIQVPKNAKLFLDLSQEVCDDMRRIRLVPNRLLMTGVSFFEKNLHSADFRELSSVHPQSLAITFCSSFTVGQLFQIGPLSSLEHLNLDHTRLDIPDFSWIVQFPKLKTLLLSSTGADDSSLPFIANLCHLEGLQLGHCKLSENAVQIIWKMANLKEIGLGSCQICDKTLLGLGSCSGLRTLDLSDSRISDAGVELLVTEALRTGLSLNSLILRSSRLTDKALVRLASLKSLTFVDIYGTEATAEGASFLKRSLPQCRVFVDRDKGGGPRLWSVDGA